MSTWVFYVDESGDTSNHHVPLLNGETPIFTLSTVALQLADWRQYDREYIYLKRRFFAAEISQSSKRSEQWEAKGNDLCAPRNKTSVRRREFLKEVLGLCERFDARLFAITFVKNLNAPVPAASLYTMGLQYLAERFSVFLAECGGEDHGITIIDKRLSKLDYQVATSHMSFVFGHETGRELTNVLEAPLFADSRLTTGLQISDNIASLVYANHYHYYCRGLDGAADYSHMKALWPRVDALQFRSKSRHAGGQPWYGFRVVKQDRQEGDE